MSQANVEIVHAVYRAAARRDRDAVLALYDPAVEWDVSDSPMARLVGGGVHHGHDGLLQFFRAYHDAWENVQYEVEELIDAGECVISIDRQSTRPCGCRTTGLRASRS